MDLSGKRILVTGASSGIGRATCTLLDELGATVILVARRRKLLEETLATLDGKQHQILDFDLTDLQAIATWMQSVASATGPLDGLVHSAGVQQPMPLRRADSSTLSATMDVNFYAAYELARGFRHRKVRASIASSIVFVSSIAGLVGVPSNSAYSASKGALLALTRTLAIELTSDSVRVNSVAPGLVETEMTRSAASNFTREQYEQIVAMHPLGLGQPSDVANAIGFLLSDAAKWITGTTLVVDGGYTAQ